MAAWQHKIVCVARFVLPSSRREHSVGQCTRRCRGTAKASAPYNAWTKEAKLMVELQHISDLAQHTPPCDPTARSLSSSAHIPQGGQPGSSASKWTGYRACRQSRRLTVWQFADLTINGYVATWRAFLVQLPAWRALNLIQLHVAAWRAWKLVPLNS